MKRILLFFLLLNGFHLFGQDKLAEDPYWEFDEQSHFRPKIQTGDFFTLTGYQMGVFVLEPIQTFIGDLEHEAEKSKSLSHGQKALYFWFCVDGEVQNGGFSQFYFNENGCYAPTIIKGLIHIGDHEMADLIQRSYTIYLERLKTINEAQKNGLEGLSSLYDEVDEFESLDSEYYTINERTLKNLEDFVRKNPNEFYLNEEGNEFDMKFTGERRTLFFNGIVKELYSVRNGVINGEYRSFYENGNVQASVKFENGICIGERIEFYENGNKKYTVQMDTTLNQFEHYWYYENGNPKKLEHKAVDKDVTVGEYKEWHENGQLSKSGTYIAPYQRSGPWLEYYPDGTKKVEAEFKEGDFLIHNCWNEKGEQILKDGTGLYILEYTILDGYAQRSEQGYLNYMRHGKQYSYVNGVLTLYQEMDEGKEHGLTRSYNMDGELEHEIVYDRGKEISRKDFK